MAFITLKLLLISGTIFPLLLSGCRPANSEENTPEELSSQQRKKRGETSSGAWKTDGNNLIDIHYFDDDEQIIFLRDDPLAKMESDNDLRSLYYREFLNHFIAEKFQEASENGAELLLTNASIAASKTLKSSSTGFSLEKSLIRKFEFAQDKFRKLKMGKDYKETYFEKAIDKKRAQVKLGQYSSYDKMPDKITTSVNVGNANFPTQHVYLGMLPDKSILNAIGDDISPSRTQGANLNVMSVVEEFELTRAAGDMKIKELQKGEITYLQKGRYKLPLGENKQLGINTWNQYSTPDRTMLNRSVLKAAIDDGASAMREGKHLYVHCKSGKGRSATVVVGSRAAVLIDSAKSNNIQLTKKEVDTIIDEQIAQVKGARSEVGISDAQRANLERVLYDRAIMTTVKT